MKTHNACSKCSLKYRVTCYILSQTEVNCKACQLSQGSDEVHRASQSRQINGDRMTVRCGMVLKMKDCYHFQHRNTQSNLCKHYFFRYFIHFVIHVVVCDFCRFLSFFHFHFFLNGHYMMIKLKNCHSFQRLAVSHTSHIAYCLRVLTICDPPFKVHPGIWIGHEIK